MSYDEGFEKVEIDENFLSEAQRLVIKGFTLEGEFRFREDLISELEKELPGDSSEPESEWFDGIRYCIHLVKNLKSSQV